MANIGSETASAGQLKDYWFDDAKNAAVPHLIKHQPFETEAWTAWQAAKKPSYVGTWLVVGHDPGRGGDYTGQLTLTAGEDDQYTGHIFLYVCRRLADGGLHDRDDIHRLPMARRCSSQGERTGRPGDATA